MNGLKRAIRDFFGFTRSQTNGFVALNFIVLLALLSEPLTRWLLSFEEKDFAYEQAMLDSLVVRWDDTNKSLHDSLSAKPQLFQFDPNVASLEELQSLGFSKGLAQRISNYRLKGGVFRIKNDLKKMYGMDTIFFHQLVPFILLPDKVEYTRSEYESPKKREKVLFDLNTADTTQLKAIYGIGSVLAKRIVSFRDKLGGFVTANQLKEVYKLDTLVVKRITEASYIDTNFQPRKININAVEVSDLQRHPYMSERVAKAIVAYRFQHGLFTSVDQLKNVKLIDEALYSKVYPYLTIE